MPNLFASFVSFFLAPLFVFSGWFGWQGPVVPSLSGPGTTTAPVACTMEAKECPDGSWVGRVPPSCDFAACPDATSVTSSAQASGAYLSSISPSSGPVGTTVTLTGFGFSASNNVVHFGGGAVARVAAAPGPAIACTTDPHCHGGIRWTITFTVPHSVGPYCAPGTACPMYMQLIVPGTYSVSVENAGGGKSNSATFTVTGTSALSQ